MSIKVCENGHVTGYKLCATCGAKTKRQARNHSEFPEVRAQRLRREMYPVRAPIRTETIRRHQQSERDRAKEKRGTVA